MPPQPVKPGTEFRSALHNLWQFILFAVRRFFSERMSSAAASLTFSTLLALVPILVIAFAILSSFSAFDAVKARMQALFLEAVVPEAGAAITDYLTNFTNSANNLTTIGVIALAVAALMLLSTIEDTFNRIWHVDRPRSFLVRFLIFWAILTMGPLLFGASFTLTTDLADYATRFVSMDLTGITSDEASSGASIVSTLLGLSISILGFTVLFVLVPARRVKIAHALAGAAFAAIAFKVLSWGFNAFLTSGSSYQTIYGAVAAVPVFLLWVYASWMVIILGAMIASTIPDWHLSRITVLEAGTKPADSLVAALAILGHLHEKAQYGEALEEDRLVDVVPLGARDDTLAALFNAGYVVQTEGGLIALVRDLHTTTVFDLASVLELSLGTSPHSQPDSRFGVGTLHERLARLFDAEREILDVPIFDIIAADRTGPAISGKIRAVSAS